jgi:prepilin-type processing-associated H-X9-DG protein/prepilin-type N-terminal cleavage/methylation domain-containing protein
MLNQTQDVRGVRSSVFPSAFTLVELLVVISIIAVLLAILMPALNKARDGAKTVACMANVRQHGIASAMYCQNNKDALIPSFDYADWSDTFSTPLIYATFLAPYIGSEKGSKSWGQGGYWTDSEKVLSVFKCPAQKDPFRWDWYIRYGINTDHASTAGPNGTGKSLKLSSISNPALRLQIADAMDNVPSLKVNAQNRVLKVMRCGPGAGGYVTEYVCPSESDGWTKVFPVADRHRGGSNVLFLDGHVNWFKYEDLMFKSTDTKPVRNTKVEMWNYLKPASYYTCCNGPGQ